jgi:hypothetical protein
MALFTKVDADPTTYIEAKDFPEWKAAMAC